MRGLCPTCGDLRALNGDGLVRRHKDRRPSTPPSLLWGQPSCPGTHRKPSQVVEMAK